MKALLDTHCWLWWLTEPEKLSDKVIGIIESPDNDIFISSASSWEIAIKYASGKLPLPEKPEYYVMSRLQRDGFMSLKIEHIHALKAGALPPHHNDPFDRMIIAQAQVEKVPIITSDKKFSMYEVELIQAR